MTVDVVVHFRRRALQCLQQDRLRGSAAENKKCQRTTRLFFWTSPNIRRVYCATTRCHHRAIADHLSLNIVAVSEYIEISFLCFLGPETVADVYDT